MKPITFKNKLRNNDIVVCDNVRDVHVIDGVEYLPVRRPDTSRIFLMRKDALERVAKKPQPH